MLCNESLYVATGYCSGRDLYSTTMCCDAFVSQLEARNSRRLFSVDHLDEEELPELMVIPEYCWVWQRRSEERHRALGED